MKVYLNGSIKNLDANNDILGSQLLFGWGVFETLRIYKGSPVFLKEHLRRLKQGCKKILLNFPAVNFQKKIGIILKMNKLSDACCRIILLKKNTKTGILITVTPFNQYSKDSYKKGFKAIVSDYMKNSSGLLSKIKSISYLENMLARKIAENKNRQEAIFLNESGFLTEGSRSNLFFVKGKTVYTPSLDCGILDGITRQKVIKIIKSQNLLLKIGKFKLKNLLSSDEAFLTSSLMEIMPLVEVDNRPINDAKPGKVTYNLHKAYKEIVSQCN